ncbi:MAG: TatD family hydrolase [Oscillospiraceae bacterium]|nr:TatD family hydrolase [Oscillospiraceae bacterium]
MIFDTHAHYDSGAFNADRETVLASMPERGVALIVNPGCEIESSRAALSLAERFPFVWAAVGIHPEDMADLPPDGLETIRSLAGHEKCVAIGEVGLDYYWDTEHKEEQKKLFAEQLALAIELDLPVIVHDREAHADCLELVSAYPAARGVFHCFSGSAEMARELLRRGWYLGFDGPVTYKNARKALEVLEITPPERILVETDSPYMSPVPLRGKRNDSANLVYIILKIAEIKGLTPQEIERITWENGKRLFGIE